eukprot:NODE_518_length_6556_cov_0.505653.p2 type:complete len:604 gc:universal NODE_518_length_6556_cov_0.505653:2364-553(-)
MLRFISRRQSSKLPILKTNKNTGKVDMQILKMLGHYVWPKDDPKTKSTVKLAMGLLISGKLLNIQVPLLLKYVVDHIHQPKHVFYGILGYGVVRSLASTASELRSAVFANIANKTIRQVAKSTYEHILSLDMPYHLNRQTGGLQRSIDRGTKGISFVLNAMVFHIVPTAFELSLVCCLLGYKYGTTFVVGTLASISAYSAFTLLTTSWRTKFRRYMNKADNNAATTATDALINIEHVKYNATEAFEVENYNKSLKEYESASLQTSYSLAFLNGGQQLIFTSGLTYLMYIASQGILMGDLTVGDLVMINALLFQLAAPLNFLGSVYRELKQSMIDMSILLKLKDEKPVFENGKQSFQLKSGQIQLDNIHFYHGKKHILQGISMNIQGGQRIGICGPSGCGKSTLIKLIFRHYNVDSGRILLDNQVISDLNWDSYRPHMGILPQDHSLFNQSILYNIQYGTNKSVEQVKEAAKLAHIHEFIESLPEGYLTNCGERGLKLSGGEKQRILLARVLLKDVKMMLLDEPTSALDMNTEKHVMANLNAKLKQEHITSLVIAHRLSTIAYDSDVIYYLNHGKIQEYGTHLELLEKKGFYHQLWSNQQKQTK